MFLFQSWFNFATDWRLIVPMLGVIVAFTTLVYAHWWRNRKRFSYVILSDLVLISAEKEIEDKVEIRFEGHSVKNVRLLVIKLINDGYQPIKKDDFEKEIKFTFPEAKILTAEKDAFHPEDIATELAYRDDWLTVAPALFNRRDYIQFKVLLSGYTDMKVGARITGVPKISQVRGRFFNTDSLFGIALLITLFFATFEDVNSSRVQRGVSLGLMGIIFLLFIVKIIVRLKED
jgi:hypothetical protein